MALELDDREADTLARRLTELTGESVTQAVRTSLAERVERLEREKLKREETADLEARIDAIVARVAALPILDHRTPDEILGYDENGLPN